MAGRRQRPGFWVDTRRKVIQRQRNKLQSWFVRHPITFGATLGLKGLTWDLPKWGVTSLYSRYGVKTVRVEKDEDVQDVTVIEHMDAQGQISSTTITRTALGAGPTPHAGQAVATVSPAERTAILTSGKALLTRTPLGQAFMRLAGEIHAFAPVRGAEAVSTVEMLHQASRGFSRISMGVEAFADVAVACGLHRQVTGTINTAAESADELAKAMARTYRQVNGLYAGQIAQDMSGATSVSAVPIQPGVGDDAAGIWPYSNMVANHYGLFQPSIGQEATEVYAYLGISQVGWALISDTFAEMPDRLRRHGVDRRVRRLINTAAGSALETATGWKAAKTAMHRLYTGQMEHEATGVSTIRTAPIVTSAA